VVVVCRNRYTDFDDRPSDGWDLPRFARALRLYLLYDLCYPALCAEAVFVRMLWSTMEVGEPPAASASSASTSAQSKSSSSTIASASASALSAMSGGGAAKSGRVTDEAWELFVARFGGVTEFYRAIKAVCQK
jgi:hypothetical protein